MAPPSPRYQGLHHTVTPKAREGGNGTVQKPHPSLYSFGNLLCQRELARTGEAWCLVPETSERDAPLNAEMASKLQSPSTACRCRIPSLSCSALALPAAARGFSKLTVGVGIAEEQDLPVGSVPKRS